jgi:MFS family permease
MSDAQEKKRSSLLLYGLAMMTLTHTLTHIFTRLYTASFPLLREEFSLSIQQIGMMAAIPPLFQTILYIPSGLITDKIGYKLMLLVSIALAILGSFLAAISSTPILLILAISFVYLNTTIYHPAAYGWTTRIFKRKERPKALGIHGAGATVGTALGPITLSFFIGTLALTWRYAYLFWILPLIISFILVLRIPQQETEDIMDEVESIEEPQTGETRKFFSYSLIFFMIFQVFRTITVHMISTFMPLYIVDEVGLTVSQMGLIYGSISLTGLFSSPIGGYIASRFGAKKWLATSIIIAMTALSLVPLVPGLLLFVATYLTYGFSNHLGIAARSTLVADLTPSRRRGLGYALLFWPGTIMGVIGPILAAYLIEILGMKSLFPISVVLTLIGMIVMLAGVKETPRL